MRARDNPFAVERVHAVRYRPLGETLEQILTRLDRMNYRGAIVGPEGSGKTTLLEDLQSALEARGFSTRMIFVNDAHPFDGTTCRRLLSELPSDEIVLFDGADAISPSCWRLLRHRTIQHARGLIVTTHRRGRFPTLIDCQTTPQLLQEIVADLLPRDQAISPDLLTRLFAEHKGNLRDCLRHLYDLLATDALPA
ncbi:MAG: hypothetical protein JW993_02845 [Sedimentisphaerales bacterium]|nr:hypothetical protein [Sedimentisphaerales bacterium]